MCIAERLCILIIISKKICNCGNGFYGPRCQHTKMCGYCLASSCSNQGICDPCPAGLSGDRCKLKDCNGNMNTIMCGGDKGHIIFIQELVA